MPASCSVLRTDDSLSASRLRDAHESLSEFYRSIEYGGRAASRVRCLRRRVARPIHLTTESAARGRPGGHRAVAADAVASTTGAYLDDHRGAPVASLVVPGDALGAGRRPVGGGGPAAAAAVDV